MLSRFIILPSLFFTFSLLTQEIFSQDILVQNPSGYGFTRNGVMTVVAGVSIFTACISVACANYCLYKKMLTLQGEVKTLKDSIAEIKRQNQEEGSAQDARDERQKEQNSIFTEILRQLNKSNCTINRNIRTQRVRLCMLERSVKEYKNRFARLEKKKKQVVLQSKINKSSEQLNRLNGSSAKQLTGYKKGACSKVASTGSNSQKYRFITDLTFGSTNPSPVSCLSQSCNLSRTPSFLVAASLIGLPKSK